MAGKAVVPKFGSWDAENIGYTVFFEKVRENKTAPVPAAAPKGIDAYEFDPYEHYETLSSRTAPSRPASSHGPGHAPAPHRPHPHYYPAAQPPPPPQHHRRTGSNGSSVAASESASSRSKFSPPRPYQPRHQAHQAQYQHGTGPGPRHQHPAQHAAAGPSPPRYAPPADERRHGQGAPQQAAARGSSNKAAVPRFGVWDDEKSAAAGAQGYTVQFEKVKRHRAEAATKAAGVPDAAVPRRLSPERPAAPHRQPRPQRRKAKTSFLSKVYGCLFPVVRH